MGRHIIIEDGTHKRESKKYGKLGKQISEYTFQEKLFDIGLTERELGWVEKSLDIEGYYPFNMLMHESHYHSNRSTC